MQAIINGKIILPQKILENHVILFDATIKHVIPRKEFKPKSCCRIFDAHDDYIAPGFINMHIHGCSGFDVMDAQPAALEIMAQSLTSTGVTAFLPTTMTYDFPKIYKALENIRTFMPGKWGARVLGCNLEGPFISQEFKGAQAAKNIIPANFDKIEQYADVIKIITIAPEKFVNDDFFQLCKKNGIVISLGHSGASYEEAMTAIDKGATHITHLFNAMTPFHHRYPGLIGAAFDSNVNCELIADNIHVHPAVQRLVYKTKNSSNIVLVTDSMRACLQKEGVSELGGQKVFVRNKIATLKDGTIAGSILTMDRAVMNFITNTGAPLTEVVSMVTVNPAKELGLYDQIGSISQDKQADMVIFDNNINIKTTFVKGVQTFQK